MCILETILSKLYTVIDDLSGDKDYQNLSRADEKSTVKFVTECGNEMVVTITKHRYVLTKPKAWFFKNKQIHLYHVTATPPKGTPTDVETIFKEPVFIPRLLLNIVGEKKQRNAILNAYLSLKLKELNRIK